MKIVMAFALIVSVSTAAAETKIIEYPDHYYVESTGIPEVKPATSPDSTSPKVSASPSAGHESSAPSPAARPVTNVDNASSSIDPAERRAEMENEILRLQRERSELLTPREGDPPEQAALRQQKAAGMLRKINKMSSELLKISKP